MAMGWIWLLLLVGGTVYAGVHGTGADATQAAMEGARQGVETAITLAGALCLWSGVAEVMEKSGVSRKLSVLFTPVLQLLFPRSCKDPETAAAISGNFTANLLGLGNAATPLGIKAVKRMKAAEGTTAASGELCRFVVLNTASIQLLPTTISALRASCGAASPFDILPAVWVSSLCSVTVGLASAAVMGRLFDR